mgnify:CR=1 FL=1
MNNLFKNLAIWMVIGIVLMTVFNQFNSRQAALASMDYSQFLEEVKQGRITKVGETYIGLEIAENVEISIQKNAVTAILPKGTLKTL